MAKKSKKSKKYYYIFVSIVVIIALLVAILDYRFSFGIVDWNQIFPEDRGGGKETIKTVQVDEIGNLTVKFIDVGQGDAILITFPDGTNMLIDAGDNKNSVKSALDKHLKPNSKKAYIDYVVLTHADADHVGSMPYVYDNYEVGYTFRPYTKSTASKYTFSNSYNTGISKQESIVYNTWLENVKNEKCDWEFFTDKSDFTYVFETEEKNYQLRVDFLMPYIQSVNDYELFGNDLNEISAIVMIEYAGIKLLFTGDIENDAEECFVTYYKDNPTLADLVDCDVLKVAHHGSDSSSTLSFINMVNPEYSVISCGIGNKYNHPSHDSLERLVAISAVYRTDLQGDITFTITPNGEIIKQTQFSQYNEYLSCDALDDELVNKIEEIESFKANQ